MPCREGHRGWPISLPHSQCGSAIAGQVMCRRPVHGSLCSNQIRTSAQGFRLAIREVVAVLKDCGQTSRAPPTAELYAESYMSTPNQGPSAPVVESVLGALERLARDLRHRTEQAEHRAADAEKRTELEREARQDAETRAAVAEQKARDALSRAEVIEAAARESIEQLRRELLAAIREAVDVARVTAATIEAAIEPEGSTEQYQAVSHRVEQDRALPHITTPAAGRTSSSSQPTPRRWGREERGYAWVEDEPGPPWWRKIFGRHY